jgi:hypothetical protein
MAGYELPPVAITDRESWPAGRHAFRPIGGEDAVDLAVCVAATP